MDMYGKSSEEWAGLIAAGIGFLVERARLRRLTSYTELNAALRRRTGSSGFDFELERDRAAMGALLGEIATGHLAPVGALLSSIVTYLNENDAGVGFYNLARHLGLLPKAANTPERERFWTSQVNTVFDHFSPTGEAR